MEADQTKAGKDRSLDLDAITMTDAEVAALESLNEGNLSPRRIGGRFLKGPVNLEWLDCAARLPGKALAVGLVLWFKRGLTSEETVSLCLERVGFGVSEQAARRALLALEQAHLVSVHRKPGRGLRVTILDPLATGEAARKGQ